MYSALIVSLENQFVSHYCKQNVNKETLINSQIIVKFIHSNYKLMIYEKSSEMV